MKRWPLVAMAVALFAASIAAAEEPSHYGFAPKPPGSVVQSTVVYLAGQAMHGQWRGVVSKSPVGTMQGGARAYQWYLSIYAIDGAVYRLKYRSPGDGGPLSKVAKAAGAPMWFPLQAAKIAGSGQFMGAGAEQLVVQSHETGADCGTARIDVFFADAAMGRVMRTLSVENGCDLDARVVHRQAGDDLLVTGPYYGKDAPLCCPTKAHAIARFHFINGQGRWTQTPKYFRVLGTQ